MSVVLDNATVVDAFAYRSELYCWTLDNELKIYRIDSLIEALERQHGGLGLKAAYALFCSRGIGASRKMLDALGTSVDAKVNSPLTLSAMPDMTISFAQKFDFLLDFYVYYDRLYIATDKGAFVVPAHRRYFEEHPRPNLELLVDTHAMALSAGLRAVATSLGKAGLSVILNEPNQLLGPRTVIHLPGPSIRSSISASRIASFPTNDECVLYRAEVARGSRRGDVGISKIDSSGEHFSQQGRSDADAYAYWDGRYGRLVSATSNGVSAYMPATGNTSTTLKEHHQLDSEPLSMSMTGNRRIVIETARQVFLSGQGDRVQFDTGPCLSVRSYKNSFRFRRLASCTAQSGLWLIALYGGFESRWG